MYTIHSTHCAMYAFVGIVEYGNRHLTRVVVVVAVFFPAKHLIMNMSVLKAVIHLSPSVDEFHGVLAEKYTFRYAYIDK